ncbi:transglycosylase SLT domain-containing protein [Actinomadura sp. LD22]|uniref:Transglycosylase SLT domain-containing protein n=1 Tax=Actinomadura physcomitrii TaxID=2650748 RepID=A0A6I4MRJ1_9ACTN|nr:bifunctional lytic transglycosylase/C40 family peptidase [Actinomadura physcomitrii]MWA07395.1 transglycosylase SLT domain-containing protein [Actinomadura physcomitrii]
MPLAIGAAVVVLGLIVVLGGVIGAMIPGSDAGSIACQPAPGRGVTDIPATYLALYRGAAREYGIGWNVLAAVGKVESDHGRGPGSGIRTGTNSAGAAGPMQFLAATWKAFGVDGNHDGHEDIYDPADAIPTASRYLRHNGAPGKIRAALFQYNHSNQYVDLVLRQSRAYASHEGDSADSGCAGTGTFMDVPPEKAAAAAISFARAQLGKPYVWGAAGPNAFDCSGLVYAAYRAAGVTVPRVSGDQWRQGQHIPNGHEQPGDLVFFNSGPGTSASNPGHVGLVIGGGRMIAAPHTGTVVQIQPYTRPALLGFTRPTAARP